MKQSLRMDLPALVLLLIISIPLFSAQIPLQPEKSSTSEIEVNHNDTKDGEPVAIEGVQ